jgi:hypothetical protein
MRLHPIFSYLFKVLRVSLQQTLSKNPARDTLFPKSGTAGESLCFPPRVCATPAEESGLRDLFPRGSGSVRRIYPTELKVRHSEPSPTTSCKHELSYILPGKGLWSPV